MNCYTCMELFVLFPEFSDCTNILTFFLGTEKCYANWTVVADTWGYVPGLRPFRWCWEIKDQSSPLSPESFFILQYSVNGRHIAHLTVQNTLKMWFSERMSSKRKPSTDLWPWLWLFMLKLMLRTPIGTVTTLTKRMSAKHCEIHVECKNRNNSSTLVFLQIAYERKQEVGPHYATGELQNCKHRRFRLSTVSFTQDYFYKFTNTIFL